MIPEIGLYTGTLRHRRFRPRAHEFTYRLFMAWLDIDQIPETMERSAWTSYNRFNWASFDERDHFGDRELSLRKRVAQDAREHDLPEPTGPIFLLTHLRYLGYCFNPISFYYCYERDGTLNSIMAEVNSTFGESRNYWLTSGNRIHSPRGFHYACPKAMHVSPFMGMDLDYGFVLTEPRTKLVAHMTTTQRDTEAGASSPFFDATLTLTHQPWTSRSVRRSLTRHPWMTAKVIAAIHWQALRLFWKRVPVCTHPDRVRPQVQEDSKRT